MVAFNIQLFFAFFNTHFWDLPGTFSSAFTNLNSNCRLDYPAALALPSGQRAGRVRAFLQTTRQSLIGSNLD
jgi:hypothetical protein